MALLELPLYFLYTNQHSSTFGNYLSNFDSRENLSLTASINRSALCFRSTVDIPKKSPSDKEGLEHWNGRLIFPLEGLGFLYSSALLVLVRLLIYSIRFEASVGPYIDNDIR